MRYSLRALDGFVIQRALQVLDPIPILFAKLGFKIPPPPPSGGLPLASSSHALTPFQAVIWTMSIANALKQITWILFTAKEPMSTKSAVMIAAFNTVMNSINTLAFSLAAINPTWSEKLFYISIPLFAIGILIESISEIQRKVFKDNSKNDGKLYSGGLFKYARHINYFGYQVWRVSMAVATGGVALGALVGGMLWNTFAKSSIPELDEYCTKKYGSQWQEVKKKVPYAFIPGIY